MPIHVLPPEVAAQIAAGEVVERPASVVKELIENSIDAGAHSIHIEAREGGQRLIQVADDGCGISPEEVPVAFARHATSKLTSIEDLNHIATLGFRGEALASVSAVSRLTLVTRARTPGSESQAGTRIRMEAGRQALLEPQAASPGTVISVEYLFQNVPARLKFLKAPATEAGHIHRVVVSYALAYPEIRFHLVLNGRQALQTSGSGDLYDVLVEVLGLKTAEQMAEIQFSQPVDSQEGDAGKPIPVSVSGYVGLPALHRAQRDQLLFFVNRRWVQERSLAAAVSQAYHTLLPVGRHPVAVINITLDPGDVDVNVHPTKSEVKFREQRVVFAAVQKAVRSSVVAAARPPQVGFPSDSYLPEGARTGFGGTRPDTSGYTSWRQMTQLGIEAQRTLPGDDISRSAVSAQELPPLRVVGQAGQTYIIAEGPDGLYLVDQHAAHERVLFEKLQAGRAAASIPVQQLLQPVTLELTPAQIAVLEAEADTLAEIGIDVEHFGGSTYRLRAVPEILTRSDPAVALGDVLTELVEGAVPLAKKSDERLMITVCKRASIKAGLTLSMTEMQQLIRDLEASSSPRTCPHGRPTMLHISAAQLAREFGRT